MIDNTSRERLRETLRGKDGRVNLGSYVAVVVLTIVGVAAIHKFLPTACRAPYVKAVCDWFGSGPLDVGPMIVFTVIGIVGSFILSIAALMLVTAAVGKVWNRLRLRSSEAAHQGSRVDEKK
jgi:hypothetical protein